MKASHTAFGVFLLTTGCSGSQVPGSADAFPSDAQACGVGIIAVASGNVDPEDLLRCGLTIADAYHLVLRLIGAENADAGLHGQLRPEAIAYRAKLAELKIRLEARGAR